MSVKERKAEIRKCIWDELEKRNIATFPRPVHGRIPNFKGATDAAARLSELGEFKNAKTVKVNPDAPQRMVRYMVLNTGKMLITPPPRLRSELNLLDHKNIPKNALYRASTISGAFMYGKPLKLDSMIEVDLIVMGSVAVSRTGARLGKGEGYAELEYAILKTIGAIDDRVPVVTTVHDVQLVDDIPSEDHDVPLDIIVTPTQMIRTETKLKKPEGIIWSKVSEEMLERMPILGEVKKFITHP
jgi:5-formyltetrahydrofolate cyclo-ligase